MGGEPRLRGADRRRRGRAAYRAARATEAATEVRGLARARRGPPGAQWRARRSGVVGRGLACACGAGVSFLGAQGALLGLLESDDVLVVDPIGIAAGVQVPGRRVLLDEKTLLSTARPRGAGRARERPGAHSRPTFPTAPDPFLRSCSRRSPFRLRRGDKPVGAVEFLFDRPNALDDELVAVASTAAGLAEQALERARLYERERETSRALERILQVAPRFYAETAEEVTAAICREARTTFGADYGVLWRIRGKDLELVNSAPRRVEWPLGLRVPLADFPGLADAVAELGVSFVPDVASEAREEGLERVRELGIRSSLRSPIVIGGRSELVLAVSWQTEIDRPDATTIAIIRRFADQAGLAFEQLERRLAEEQAAARAQETERLQEVTAALSLAASSVDVGDTCLKHALRFVGAEAGFVVLTGSGGTSVQMLSNVGYSDDALEAWSALGLDADVPFARAIASGEPVWALSRDEMDVFTGAPALDEAGWVSRAAPDAGRYPRRAPRFAPRSHGAHGGGAQMAAERRLAMCSRARAQQSLRGGATSPRAVRESPTDHRGPLECADARVTSQTSSSPRHGKVPTRRRRCSTSSSTSARLCVRCRRQGFRRTATGPRPRCRSTTVPSSRAWCDVEARGSSRRTPARRSSARGSPCRWSRVARPSASSSSAGPSPSRSTTTTTAFSATLASQGAQALDRARHFESERSIAETLQRSVLPVTLPRVAGVQIAARYLPGTQGRTSAETGSTPSSCATAGSASSSATSWGRECMRPRTWGSCETPFARSPSSG